MKASKIPFVKMSGSGNDFVILDNWAGNLPAIDPILVRAFCRRREGVGADGMLVVERSERADFCMRYFNSDGSRAGMCGNGGRCVCWFAHSLGRVGEELVFEADDGLHRARIRGKRVEVEIRPPRNIQLGLTLNLRRKELTVNRLDVGVPHVVIVVRDVSDVDIERLGREIRRHPHFAPAGANVDFLQFLTGSEARIRTYERGVEGETLACGTGAVASPAVGELLGKLTSPVEVLTQGGERLNVRLTRRGTEFDSAFLEGAVEVLFEGSYFPPSPP